MRREGCEFTGSYADQIFICIHCGAYPEDCEDGDCCCPDRTETAM